MFLKWDLKGELEFGEKWWSFFFFWHKDKHVEKGLERLAIREDFNVCDTIAYCKLILFLSNTYLNYHNYFQHTIDQSINIYDFHDLT